MATDIETGRDVPPSALFTSGDLPASPVPQPAAWPSDENSSPAQAQQPVADVTGQMQGRRTAGTAAASAAQASAAQTEYDRREALEGSLLAGAHGVQIDLPVVPTMAVPPSLSALYPYAGDEPVA